MHISAINNSNQSFGNCKAIYCRNAFSKSNPRHAEILKEFKNSEAFKKFGEKYDYVAEFYYKSEKTGKPSPYTFGLLDEYKHSYSLVLRPVLFRNPLTLMRNRLKGISNLPIKFDITPFSKTTEHVATSSFHSLLKAMTLEEINKYMQYEIDHAKFKSWCHNNNLI